MIGAEPPRVQGTSQQIAITRPRAAIVAGMVSESSSGLVGCRGVTVAGIDHGTVNLAPEFHGAGGVVADARRSGCMRSGVPPGIDQRRTLAHQDEVTDMS